MDMDEKGTHQRKVYLINREFQVRFVLKVILVVLLATVASGIAFYFIADQQISGSFYSTHQQIRNVREILFWPITLGALLFFTTVAALCVFITIRETHKLVGPLYRFQQNLKMIAEGHLDTLTRIREGDELRDLMDSFNLLSGNLTQVAKKIEEAVEDIKKSLQEAERTGVLRGPELEKLGKEVHELEKVSAFFRR